MKRFIEVIMLLAAFNVAAAELLAERPGTRPIARNDRLAELLAQHRARPVIVSFWASWCEPCREEMPSLQRLSERWRRRGLSVLTVAVADDEARSSRFLREISVDLPVLYDPDQAIAHAWDVHMLPTALVMDRRHRIVARGRGAIEWDSAPIEAQLQIFLK